MAVIKLITRTDIREYKQVSNTLHDDVLNPCIIDAQFIDIQKLLGVELYEDLIANSTDVKYTALLDGGSYTYSGNTYNNVGLKAVIAHYAYARYILFGSNIDTPFSFVGKTNGDSEKVDEKEKLRVYKLSQQMAFNYFENVARFLNRDSTNYPLWNGECGNLQQKFKINKIIN